jgi:hypothetical protein
MPRQASPRTIKPPNGSAARKRRNSPAPSSSRKEAPAAPMLSYEALAARAYALFLARGGQPGDDLRDWFQAEVELRQELVRGGNAPRAWSG